MKTVKNIFKAMIVTAIVGYSTFATAQKWPTPNVKIIVPFSAGGATDVIARRLADKMQKIIDRPVVVQNVTGGGSVIGMQQVVSGKPDGGTLVFTGSSSITVMKHTMSALPIDPEKQLTPITFVNTLPHWIVVKADRPEKTFEDLIDHIRKNPKKVNISVNQLGGAAHLALANWIKKNNLDLAIIPYRGSSAAMIDVIGGNITAHVDVIGSSLPLVKAGKARALALLQQEPIPSLPGTPPSPPEESGGLKIGGQHVLAVKTGTSKEVINKIYEVVKQVVNEPEFTAFIKDQGFEVSLPDPDKSQRIIHDDSELFKELVRTTNIRIN